MMKDRTPFVLYGGDYNPEQWDDKTIDEDMKLFQQAGVNLLTLPVFAWAKIEPREGEYQFEWLDQILAKIWEHRIHVFLATPTTAQPAWLSKKYEDVLPVDIAGRKRTHGMRVFFCVNSEHYRIRAAALAHVMAERYKDFPGLAGWHVSNEYGTYCYCEHCQEKFRVWLKNRYGTIEELNRRWHTSFWGRGVYGFDEIMLPTERNDDYRFNPAVQLDYMRFVTDSTLECYHNEADILKKATPDLPVFTNISGYIKKLNQFQMVPEMDCAGWDNYPSPKDPYSFPALKHDIMRAAGDGASYIVTEQSPNQQNWQPYNKLKRPGELRRIAYQGLAHGADSSLYFQMRQSVGGQEKNHGAFIAHCGADTRIFKEACRIGGELKLIGDKFLKGRIYAKAAIMMDWENWWALELSSGPSKDMDYLSQMHKYYKPFLENNIPVDIIKATTDLSTYQVLVLPLMYMIKPGMAERIEAVVAGGGTLLATYMTGRADENDRCIFGAYPGPLKEVLGMWVEETDALYPEEANDIIVQKGLGFQKEQYSCKFLCDVIRLTTAEVMAVYGGDFYKDTPVLTKNFYGSGSAFYLGSEPEEEFLTELIVSLCEERGVTPEFSFHGKLEITTRRNEWGNTVFILNHGSEPGRLDLKEVSYEDLLHKKQVSGSYELAAGDVAVLWREETSTRLSSTLIQSYPCYDQKEVNRLLAEEAASDGHKIIILDDDPTGVQTVHDVSVYTDWSMESIRSGFAEENKLFFILTNSRGFTVEQTTQAHLEIAERIDRAAKESGMEYLIISRGDSTLRGHYPLETRLLKEVQETENSWSVDGEILCPFFAEGGRFTIGNVHYVRSGEKLVPVGETEFAKDKTFGYVASNLCEYIEEKTEGVFKADSVTCISLEDLRAMKLDRITEQLISVKDFGKIVVNAVDEYDVKVFCIALYRAMAQGRHFTFRTAATFVKAIGCISDKPLLTRAEMVTLKKRTGGIVVVGSHTKKTTMQVEELKKRKDILFIEMNSDLVLEDGGLEREVHRIQDISSKAICEGQTVVIYTKRQLLVMEHDTKEAALARSVKISEAVQSLVGRLEVTPGFVVAKGGITSSDVGTKALRVKRAKVLGQIRPGIPVWQTGEESRFPGTPYVIFPGNVGEAETLREVVEILIG